jgi:hypothetical protein
LSLSLSRDSGGNEVLSSPDRSNYSYSFDEEEDEEIFQTPGGQEFDWNTPFQACLNSKESAQKYLNIVRLISDFVEVSSVYGKIIISEVCVFLLNLNDHETHI